MGTLRTILRELVGLFIDDGSLAAGAVVWAAICGWGLPALGVGAQARAALLILENTVRAAAGGRRRP